MTAEVAVLNRSAVALAADSAVTVSSQSSAKVYNTVNKLFTLSKFHPIGIMVYGNAEYMGVPWETIIKLYREHIDRTLLDTVNDFAEDFIAFVKKSIPVTDDDQRRRVLQIWNSYFESLNSRIRAELLDEAASHALSQKEAAAIFLRVLKREAAALRRNKQLPQYSSVTISDVVKKYAKEIKAATAAHFRGRRFTPAISKLLSECAGLVIINDDFRFSTSGVVVAGFGKKELFPGIYRSLCSGTILDQLRMKADPYSTIGPAEEKRALMFAFAQREMVVRFMEGADQKYLSYLDFGIRRLIHQVSDHLLDKYSSGDASERKKRAARVRVTVNKMIDDFSKRAADFRYDNFTEKVLDVVSILPKDELAELAGALVEITSLKRKISMDADTVGGPIDVAVISKGDGFIWIKRKHYFEPELNPFFLRKYLADNPTT